MSISRPSIQKRVSLCVSAPSNSGNRAMFRERGYRRSMDATSPGAEETVLCIR